VEINSKIFDVENLQIKIEILVSIEYFNIQLSEKKKDKLVGDS